MARSTQKPTMTGKDQMGERWEHPAYGAIRASRVSGETRLFDSDFKHRHYITVSISNAVMHRGLSSDWLHAKSEMVEVALTESQWATFVSSLNHGSGVPCTLQRFNGALVPGIEPADPRPDVFDKEVRETLDDAVASLRKALAALDDKPTAANRAAARAAVSMAITEITSNLGFVAKQFGEHMERHTEKSKAEIHAMMTRLISEHGLAALQGKTEEAPLEIAGQASS